MTDLIFLRNAISSLESLSTVHNGQTGFNKSIVPYSFSILLGVAETKQSSSLIKTHTYTSQMPFTGTATLLCFFLMVASMVRSGHLQIFDSWGIWQWIFPSGGWRQEHVFLHSYSLSWKFSLHQNCLCIQQWHCFFKDWICTLYYEQFDDLWTVVRRKVQN